MKRKADYSIKGFIYQFNLTLLKVLEDQSNCNIRVEGIIEDIDIIYENRITAIQCKYHESKDKYNLSDIYKPILQMMVNYVENKQNDIQYILYAYFSGEESREIQIYVQEIEEILDSDNKDYICKYISKIKPPTDKEIQNIINGNKIKDEDKKKVVEYYKENRNALECIEDINEFIKSFKIVIGDKFEELCLKIKNKMIEESLKKDDIEDLFYPNAIQKIADLSIKHNCEERIITKSALLNDLKNTKTTAISRLTRELQSYSQMMKKRRKQLEANLDVNIKKRYFIIDASIIEDFEEGIITFIDSYNIKYNNSICLSEIPMFCIDKLELKELGIRSLEARLHKKNIIFENGIRGDIFFRETYLRDPKKVRGARRCDEWREFDIRFSLNCSSNHFNFAVFSFSFRFRVSSFKFFQLIQY